MSISIFGIELAPFVLHMPILRLAMCLLLEGTRDMRNASLAFPKGTCIHKPSPPSSAQRVPLRAFVGNRPNRIHDRTLRAATFRSSTRLRRRLDPPAGHRQPSQLQALNTRVKALERKHWRVAGWFSVVCLALSAVRTVVGECGKSKLLGD